MKGRVLPSLREAIHACATGSGKPMKVIAGELDMSPSELSHRTTLGGDNAKPFPADDRLIKLQRETGDHSPLYTMADALGYELKPKSDRLGDVLAETQQRIRELLPAMQMVLDLGQATVPPSAPGAARRPKG